MENLVAHYEDGTQSLSSFSEIFARLQNATLKFQTELASLPRETTDQESIITFYKQTLPNHLCQVFHYSMWLNGLISSRNEELDLDSFLGIVHEQCAAFKSRESELYIYFRSGLTEMDSLLFTPTAENLVNFKAPYDFSGVSNPLPAATIAFARFKGFESVMSPYRHSHGFQHGASLTWTGTQAGLTELIYALNEMGVINGKHNDIKCLKTAFEQLFGFNLGNIYKTYENNRMRKKSRTPFLECLRNALLRRMEDDDLNAL